MCYHQDCPNKDNPRAKTFLYVSEEIKSNPLFTRELDMAPDGWHAKPMRLWAKKPQKKRAEPSASMEDLRAERDRLMEAWSKLPEPRPDPMDFAAYHTRWDQWFELRVMSKRAPLYGDRIKANSTLLDFAKTRPKQQFELLGDDLSKASDHELLRKALEANGLPAALADELKKKHVQ